MRSRRSLVALGLLLGGCGLVLDLGPPDPDVVRYARAPDGSMDAGMDAATEDAAVPDAEPEDARRPDGRRRPDARRLDTGTGDAAPDAGCGGSCGVEQVCCDGTCVDVFGDPEHCGFCGHVCTSGICLEGRCAECEPTATGACGDTDLKCSDSGRCVSECDGCSGEGAMCCSEDSGSLCIDTLSDPNHCGDCGRACPPLERCERGVCVCGPDGLLCEEGERCFVNLAGLLVCLPL